MLYCLKVFDIFCVHVSPVSDQQRSPSPTPDRIFIWFYLVLSLKLYECVSCFSVKSGGDLNTSGHDFILNAV